DPRPAPVLVEGRIGRQSRYCLAQRCASIEGGFAGSENDPVLGDERHDLFGVGLFINGRLPRMITLENGRLLRDQVDRVGGWRARAQQHKAGEGNTRGRPRAHAVKPYIPHGEAARYAMGLVRSRYFTLWLSRKI